MMKFCSGKLVKYNYIQVDRGPKQAMRAAHVRAVAYYNYGLFSIISIIACDTFGDNALIPAPLLRAVLLVEPIVVIYKHERTTILKVSL